MTTRLRVMRHAIPARGYQRGQMGIIGTLLGIALFGIALYLVVSHFHDANISRKVAAQSQQSTSLIDTIRKLYNGSPTGFAGLSGDTLIQNGAVPPGSVSGTQLVTVFGTPLQVAPATAFAANDSFAITYQSIDKAICAQLAEALSGQAFQLAINGTTVQDSRSGTLFSQVGAAGACSAGATATISMLIEAQ